MHDSNSVILQFFFVIYGCFLCSINAGEGIGGKKPGALTQDKIKVLCRYYAKAVWSHDDVPAMQKAIQVQASIHHLYSTHEHPRHQYCPAGADSWCFYKRGLAKKDNVYEHKKRIHHALDFERLHKHLAPIYERLTDPALLARCKQHKTQNANESFHQTMWTRCSKIKKHSLRQVRFALATAWSEFNFGPRGLTTLDRVYGPDVGRHTHKLRKDKETKRLKKSEWASAGNEKRRRKKVADGRKRAAEEDAAVSYGAGLF